MKVLVVFAHPLSDSYAAAIRQVALQALAKHGHEIDELDLYATDFDPRLSAVERAAYMTGSPDATAVADHVNWLKNADSLVLIFPTWCFNMPASLKGWIDRVFQPGIAFIPDPAGGRSRHGLDRLRAVHVIATTGSPWWVVRLWMGDPVRRTLKRGIFRFCAPKARFRMLALNDMDRASETKRADFLDKVRRHFSMR